MGLDQSFIGVRDFGTETELCLMRRTMTGPSGARQAGGGGPRRAHPNPHSSVLIIGPRLPIKHFSVSEIKVKAPIRSLICLLVVAALSGCAQLQALRSDGPQQSASATQTPTPVVDFTIPPDALGARDPHLTAILGKVGAVASKQSQPTTIRVAALAQDFPYLNQAIKRGIAPSRAATIRLEDLAVGSCQPYRIQLGPTE